MQSKQQAVLITGASGLIGRELCRQLAGADIPFIALVRPGGSTGGLDDALDVIEVDLGTRFAISRPQLPAISSVIHLAQAENYSAFPCDSGEVAALTLGATTRLAELACSIGAERFVFASSGGVYGFGSQAFSEDSELRPGGELGFYLAAKATAERMLQFYSPHLRIVCLRYFFVFGPQQRKQMLLSRLIESVRHGKPVSMPGERGPMLNPIYVEDAARATLRSLSCDTSPAINVAGDEVLDLYALCERIAAVLRRPANITPTGGEARSLVADVTLMRKTLGRCEVSLDEGIRRCVAETAVSGGEL